MRSTLAKDDPKASPRAPEPSRESRRPFCLSQAAIGDSWETVVQRATISIIVRTSRADPVFWPPGFFKGTTEGRNLA